MASLVLNGDIMVKKVYFGLLVNTHILVYCPIVSSKSIFISRVETLDIGNIPLTRWCKRNIKIQLYP